MPRMTEKEIEKTYRNKISALKGRLGKSGQYVILQALSFRPDDSMVDSFFSQLEKFAPTTGSLKYNNPYSNYVVNLIFACGNVAWLNNYPYSIWEGSGSYDVLAENPDPGMIIAAIRKCHNFIIPNGISKIPIQSILLQKGKCAHLLAVLAEFPEIIDRDGPSLIRAAPYGGQCFVALLENYPQLFERSLYFDHAEIDENYRSMIHQIINTKIKPAWQQRIPPQDGWQAAQSALTLLEQCNAEVGVEHTHKRARIATEPVDAIRVSNPDATSTATNRHRFLGGTSSADEEIARLKVELANKNAEILEKDKIIAMQRGLLERLQASQNNFAEASTSLGFNK